MGYQYLRRPDGNINILAVERRATQNQQAKDHAKRKRVKQDTKLVVDTAKVSSHRQKALMETARRNRRIQEANGDTGEPVMDWEPAGDVIYNDADTAGAIRERDIGLGPLTIEETLADFIPKHNRSFENASRRLKLSTMMTLLTKRLGTIYATGKMTCKCSERDKGERNIICIEIKDISVLNVKVCKCEDWAGRLIIAGYFPTIPNAHTAISLECLELFQAVSSHGSFSKAGFAQGLELFHRILRRRNGCHYTELFRNCVQFWLRVRLARDDYVHEILNSHFRYKEATNPLRDLKGRAPIVLETGSMQSQCPCCFYRLSDPVADDPPVILAIDGNMQHSRWRNVAKGSLPYPNPKLFVSVPQDLQEQVDTSVPVREDEEICKHNFKGSAKPRTMQFYDETGLLLVVCRHDMPLRFLNIYAGERLGWIQFTIKELLKIVESEVYRSPVADPNIRIEVIILYDIACQLEPFLRKNDSELADRINIAVNKFHGYAHEFRCQEMWGTHQQKGVAESDGEGTERIWALLRTLVSSGASSSANRMLFIENLALAISTRKRMGLGRTIRLRYKRYKAKLEDIIRQLALIIGTKVSLGEGKPEVEITEELLEDQRGKQRTYFSTISPLVSKPNVAIWKLVENEKRLARELQDEMDQSKVIAKQAKLNTATNQLDAALETAGHTRVEWVEGGERWNLAYRFAHPDREIFKLRQTEEVAKSRWKKAVAANQTRAIQDDLEAKYEKARTLSNQRINQSTTARAHWEVGGLEWTRHNHIDVVSRLEVIYHRLLRSAASRAMEFRHLKGRVSGRKQAERMLRSLMSRYPAMERDIKSFNTAAESIEKKYRPPPLEMSAFRDAAREEQVDGVPRARHALFALQLFRSALIGPDPHGPQDLWALCPNVRAGIELQQRRDRGKEELEVLEKEWERLVVYTQQLLVGLFDFTKTAADGKESDVVKSVYPMLWAELKGGRNLLIAGQKTKDNHLVVPAAFSKLLNAIDHHLEINYKRPMPATRQFRLPQEAPNAPLRPGQPAAPEGVLGIDLTPKVEPDMDELMRQIMEDPVDDNGDRAADFQQAEPDGLKQELEDAEYNEDEEDAVDENVGAALFDVAVAAIEGSKVLDQGVGDENPDENEEEDEVEGL